MSAESGNSPSRHSNGSYPALDVSGPEPPESENADQPKGRPDVPTVEERIDGLTPKLGAVLLRHRHHTPIRPLVEEASNPLLDGRHVGAVLRLIGVLRIRRFRP